MNSPKIPVKSVHPAGGQSRPPLQRVRRVVVGADDSVGPLRSYKFAVDSRKNGAFCRADMTTIFTQKYLFVLKEKNSLIVIRFAVNPRQRYYKLVEFRNSEQ